MNALEAGFLLLTSQLGDPDRKPLTVAQFRTLAQRVRNSEHLAAERELQTQDLLVLGYSQQMAQRIVTLLEDQTLLEYYLSRARKCDCVPLTRAGEMYPLRVRQALGEDSPGCLWAKGDLSLLEKPCVSLVGSRDLRTDNRKFARQVGFAAAKQGFVLVSGNARGADKTAQESCLEAGGSVICVVADSLEKQKPAQNVLCLSEEGFDSPFSSQRALSRNRVIHTMGAATFVAQSSYGAGGSWDGTAKNLQHDWNCVFCYDDGSDAAAELGQMGAHLIQSDDLRDINMLLKANAQLRIV